MNSASTPFFTSADLRGRFLEAIEYLREHIAQDVSRALAHVDGPIVGASVIAAETDAAGQAGGLYETVQARPGAASCRIFSSPMSDGFVRRFGFAFLPGQHLFGAEELDSLSVYRVVERDSPKHALALLLATGTQFRRECLEGCVPTSASWTWNIMSPLTISRPWIARDPL